MKKALSICLVAAVLRICCPGQEPAGPASTPSSQAAVFGADRQPSDDAAMPAGTHSSKLTAGSQAAGMQSKFSYYLAETYFNPGALTAPAFRAGLHMANPPGNGATKYPAEWRQGAEGFGRNYGDAFASRVSAHTAQFLTGAILREDPRYAPAASHGFFARSAHAIAFTFVDRSDSGSPMPAFSNLAGAAASGFVGNAYLPAGFEDMTHAGQRATLQLGMFAAGNLFREFALQMPRPVRLAISLIAR
jgi:hypothetical protein